MALPTLRSSVVAIALALARIFCLTTVAILTLSAVLTIFFQDFDKIDKWTLTARNVPRVCGLCLIASTGWLIQRTFHRLYFHNLSHFPGPKIAAFTQAYEFYFDVIVGGQYTWVIEDMHKRYGPIVRISPHELHIQDPSLQDEVFASAAKPRDKWAWSQGMFGIDSGMQTTALHEQHRRRRGALSSLFSKKAVVDLSSVITALVEQMCKRLEESEGKGPVVLNHAFYALSLDLMTHFSLGEPYGALRHPSLMSDLTDSMLASSASLYINQFFPWSKKMLQSLPSSFLEKLIPSIGGLLLLQRRFENDAVKAMTDSDRTPKHGAQRYVFNELITSDELPREDRHVGHLVATALNVIGGGTFTPSHVLVRSTFYLLKDPAKLAKLKEELIQVMPDPDVVPPLHELEKLEYLTAIIHEGNRISIGVAHRLQRIYRTPMQYGEYTIPAGTPVGMTWALIARDPDIFPDPYEFRPERYLPNAPGVEKAKKYFNAFGKGTRNCLGMNLANAEMYFAFAIMFRRLDMILYKTDEDDVRVARDYFAPLPKIGARGCRVLIK